MDLKVRECGVDSADSVWCSLTGCCGHINEVTCSIKVELSGWVLQRYGTWFSLTLMILFRPVTREVTWEGEGRHWLSYPLLR